MTTFVKVVDCGGFSAAARRLDLSPAMVSTHIQALEERLGARLLNRTTRKISLTEVGKAYYERCTQILTELEEADRVAAQLQSTPRGTLRLNVGTHIARFVAPVIADFLDRYPDVSIDLTMTERMVDLIEEGFDLAVRITPTPDSSLIVRRLVPWRHVLCCAPAYLDRCERPEKPADLAWHNCLRYAHYPFGNKWRFVGPEGEQSVQLSGNLRSNSAEVLRAAAIRGRGLFLAPGFLVADDLRSGRLVPVLPDFLPVAFAINAIYAHRRHLSAKVRHFIDLLADHFDRDMKWAEADDPP